MGENQMSLKVERIENATVNTWSVMIGGKLSGMVVEVGGSVELGRPAYRAIYWTGGEVTTHPEIFEGEFANVRAVETIINRAK